MYCKVTQREDGLYEVDDNVVFGDDEVDVVSETQVMFVAEVLGETYTEEHTALVSAEGELYVTEDMLYEMFNLYILRW